MWRYDNDPWRKFVFMLFKFPKPAGYSTGTLRWKIVAECGGTIYVSRWINDSYRWEVIDSASGGQLEYVTGVSSSWFSSEGELWLMADVLTTSNYPAVVCDVCDIQYEY